MICSESKKETAKLSEPSAKTEQIIVGNCAMVMESKP